MKCYSCEKISTCSIFQNLYKVSSDFNINNCFEYIETSKFKYRKIAEHDELMALIYDYFTDQIEDEISSKYSDEEIREIIKRNMFGL